MISCGNSKSGLNESKTKKQKPNIIFILLDDLGKEWISKYDADDIETPNIDVPEDVEKVLSLLRK